METRLRFSAFLHSQMDHPVLWGAKGIAKHGKVKVEGVFDCSGLVTSGILAVGGPDLRSSYNAQRLADESPYCDAPIEGDLVFYGSAWDQVIHVGVWLAGGRCLTASGATSRVTSLTDSLKAQHRVEIQPVVKYRKDFLGVHTNVFLDLKPKVTS